MVSDMPTRDELAAIPDRYLAAVSAGDVDAIMALYNDDPWVEDPIGQPAHEGAAAVRAFYQALADSGVKITLTRITPVTVAGLEVAFCFRVDVDLGGSTMSMATIDTMVFDDDGRIARMRAFADSQANPDQI